MKLLIFGSTGGTGRELIMQAVGLGHSAAAFARNPTNLEEIQHPLMTVVSGDVLDPDALEGAVTGHDAVMVAIGAGAKRSSIREDGTRTGVYRHVFSLTDRRIKGWITRADVADFMLKQMVDHAYRHKTPGLSYYAWRE